MGAASRAAHWYTVLVPRPGAPADHMGAASRAAHWYTVLVPRPGHQPITWERPPGPLTGTPSSFLGRGTSRSHGSGLPGRSLVHRPRSSAGAPADHMGAASRAAHWYTVLVPRPGHQPITWERPPGPLTGTPSSFLGRGTSRSHGSGLPGRSLVHRPRSSAGAPADHMGAASRAAHWYTVLVPRPGHQPITWERPPGPLSAGPPGSRCARVAR